ncbi:MAG: hypothetical protein KJO50_11975 [Bacteroidia bacterium]|nr:hypothetical protein [Bacteroidia bacterium]
MLDRFFDWLEDHRKTNIFLLFIYYLGVVLPHEWVGKMTVKIFGGLSRQNYNLLIAFLVFMGLAGLSILFFRKWKAHPKKTALSIYIVSTFILIMLCFKVFFVVNIEAIHFAQYAGFVLLSYPLFKNSVTTFMISGLAGAIDEWYQYSVLAPQNTNYYDFNDVIINLIGAAIGLIIIKLHQRKDIGYEWRSFYKNLEFRILFVFLIILIGGYLTGYVSIYDDPSNPALFSFVKIPEQSFWTIPPGPPAKFHVLRPLEGIVLIIAVCGFYFGLNRIY